MPTLLAIDLGKTGCRAAVWSDDGAAGPVRAGPGAPGLTATGGVEAAERAISALTADLPPGALRVAVGAAGAAAAPAAARDLAGRLAASLPAEQVAVCSDAVTSHAGALAGRVGVVLAAGTGAVAVGLGTSGQLVLLDGAGPWLGDEGSGAWIGLAGLRAAVRAADGRGPATALTAAATAWLEVAVAALPAALAGSGDPVRTAAAFAPEVARLAADGDRVADRILLGAAGELAATVGAAAARLDVEGPVDVALTGGLLGLGAPLLDPLGAALAALPVRVVPARGGALEGARLLAEDRTTRYEDLVVRVAQQVRT